MVSVCVRPLSFACVCVSLHSSVSILLVFLMFPSRPEFIYDLRVFDPKILQLWRRNPRMIYIYIWEGLP